MGGSGSSALLLLPPLPLPFVLVEPLVEFPVETEPEEKEEEVVVVTVPVVLLHPILYIKPAMATAWETLRVATEVVVEAMVARLMSVDVEV